MKVMMKTVKKSEGRHKHEHKHRQTKTNLSTVSFPGVLQSDTGRHHYVDNDGVDKHTVAVTVMRIQWCS